MNKVSKDHFYFQLLNKYSFQYVIRMIDTDLPINKDIQVQKCQPLDIGCRDISYRVQVQDKSHHGILPCFKKFQQKQLLNKISGIFKAGELSAIMGASGAGKTTLLNVSACRLPKSQVNGSVTVNSQPYNYEIFGDFGNYVMQNDVLIQTLTVRQTLEFAANLKLNVSDQQKKIRIDLLTRKLKLQKCLDVLVGGQLIKGVSGGEKKRTSIAFELISNPSVLILDEPTSGLDSLTSFIIVRYLKKLANREGKNVFMTIHQPDNQIYVLFDRLLLLVQGRLIYQGPAATAKQYFSKHMNLQCPQFHNPSDYFMSIMHHQNPKNRERYPMLFETYDKHIAPQIQKLMQSQSKQIVQKRIVDVSACTSFKALVRRDFLNVTRNPLLIKLRFFQTIIMSLYPAGIYYQFSGDYTSRLNWQALAGFYFYLSISMIMLALAPVQLVFPSERNVFLKEQSAKLYGTFSYFVSRNMVQIPYSIIFPLLMSLIIYWFVGLASTATQFFLFYLIAYLLTFNGISLGLLLGSVMMDTKSVSTVTPLILVPLFLFSGFLKNTGNLASWIGWIQYVSPIKYSFSAFVQNQVQFASNSNVGQLNFDIGMWLSIGILIILGITLRLLSLFFLWRLRIKLE